MKILLLVLFGVVFVMGIKAAEAGIVTKKPRTVANAEKSTFTDTVKKIRDDDEGSVILFNSNAGSYYLRRDVADFEVLKKKLDEAFKNKKPVSVTFDSAQLNILEVK